jgi:hypothetical protein
MQLPRRRPWRGAQRAQIPGFYSPPRTTQCCILCRVCTVNTCFRMYADRFVRPTVLPRAKYTPVFSLLLSVSGEATRNLETASHCKVNDSHTTEAVPSYVIRVLLNRMQ